VSETGGILAQDDTFSPDDQFKRGVQVLRVNGKEGARLIESAAEAGHRDALALQALFVARGIDRRGNWREAMSLLARAAAAGNPRAAQQVTLLGAGFDADAWIAAPPARMQFEAPRIGVIQNFLPPDLCAWLIACARVDLQPALINDAHTGKPKSDGRRSNSAMSMTLFKLDIVAQLVKARIATALQAPMSHQEVSNILHYQVGQEFRVHFDFQNPALPGDARMLDEKGQRIATFLIYLNDDFEGGETDFPILNWRFKGKTGDALFFWNVDRDGAAETKLAHAGLPPASGEKWLFSQWVRAKPIALI
jgi:prolyl 4-hydroxylase